MQSPFAEPEFMFVANRGTVKLASMRFAAGARSATPRYSSGVLAREPIARSRIPPQLVNVDGLGVLGWMPGAPVSVPALAEPPMAAISAAAIVAASALLFIGPASWVW